MMFLLCRLAILLAISLDNLLKFFSKIFFTKEPLIFDITIFSFLSVSINSGEGKSDNFSTISLPIEFLTSSLPETFQLTDEEGHVIYSAKPLEIRPHRTNQSTLIAKFSVPADIATDIVGFQLQPSELETREQSSDIINNDTIVCRCERVTAGEIRSLIKEGVTDINQIKAITRAGMGACGSKTCHLLIQRLLREEGVAASDIILNTSRPLEFEVEFQVLANSTRGDD